ncbi:MAG: glycosyltransferase family 2 protein [Candidatus Binatia bacterium]
MASSSQAPRVSVAMPVRNAQAWLHECVDSVLAQTEAAFELLAVDDGSTDASRAILEAYARDDARVRVLETSASSRGIVAALNLALAAARAPRLARMDADDRMHAERLARQAGALDADASLFGVASRAAAFPEEEVRDGMRAYVAWQNSLLTPEEIARDRFIESPVLHPSVMLRTKVVRDRLGGWRDCAGPEDWDFFLRAFEAGLRIGRVPASLLEWRVHAHQLTRTHSRYSEDSLLEARAGYLARYLAGVAATERSIWVLGAGPVGKGLVKALARHGVNAHGLADVDPRKIGGVVRGGGRNWRVVAHSGLRVIVPRPFAVSAVSGADARARVRAELASWGWVEEADYVVAA